MNCPNPACKKELFKAQVIWKQGVKDLPEFLPVELTCANCGRKIKAYILNENIQNMIIAFKEMDNNIKLIHKYQEILHNAVMKEVRKKRWWKFW